MILEVISELKKHVYTSKNREGKEKANTLQKKKKSWMPIFKAWNFA